MLRGDVCQGACGGHSREWAKPARAKVTERRQFRDGSSRNFNLNLKEGGGEAPVGVPEGVNLKVVGGGGGVPVMMPWQAQQLELER